MSEENITVWSAICSVFSISKSAIKMTNQALTEFSDYASKSFDEWRVERAEEWCRKQGDEIIYELTGGVAVIAYEYYFSYMSYLMNKSSDSLQKALQNKNMLDSDIVFRVNKIINA